MSEPDQTNRHFLNVREQAVCCWLQELEELGRTGPETRIWSRRMRLVWYRGCSLNPSPRASSSIHGVPTILPATEVSVTVC
jgi:hypothetical protein